MSVKRLPLTLALKFARPSFIELTNLQWFSEKSVAKKRPVNTTNKTLCQKIKIVDFE